MASQGPLSGSTFADDSGVGSAAWSSPSNAASSNNSYASASISFAASSHYLKATNFGFSIPSGATIDGIIVEWEKSDATESGAITDLRSRIVKGGTIGSTDKSSATAWPAADAYTTYGSSSDKWGETWTDSDINGSTFGAVIAAQATGPGSVAQIDHVRITVHYTEATFDAATFVKGVQTRGQGPPPPGRVLFTTAATEPTNWQAFDVATYPRCQVIRGRYDKERPANVSGGVNASMESALWTPFDASTLANFYHRRGALEPQRPMRGGVTTPQVLEPDTFETTFDPSTAPPSIVVEHPRQPVARGSVTIAFGKMHDPAFGEQEQPRVWAERGRWPIPWPQRSAFVWTPQEPPPSGFDAWAGRVLRAVQPRARAGKGAFAYTPEMSGPHPAVVTVGQRRYVVPRSQSWIAQAIEPVLSYPSRWGVENRRSVRPVPVSRSHIANVHPTLAETMPAVVVAQARSHPPRGSVTIGYVPDFLSARLQALPVVTTGTGRAALIPGRRATTATVYEPMATGGIVVPSALVALGRFWPMRSWLPQTRLFWVAQTIDTSVRKDDRDSRGPSGRSQSNTGGSGRNRTSRGVSTQG